MPTRSQHFLQTKRPALVVTLGACLAFLVTMPLFITGKDFGSFVLSAILLSVISLIVFVGCGVFWRKWRVSLVLLLTYGLTLWIMSRTSYSVHDRVRWTLRGSSYKQVVLSHRAQAGQLQHVEWDGWGGPGAGDTTIYLVFDPTDSLVAYTKENAVGEVPGIPCALAQLRRLSPRWYEATPYTDTDWDHC